MEKINLTKAVDLEKIISDFNPTKKMVAINEEATKVLFDGDSVEELLKQAEEEGLKISDRYRIIVVNLDRDIEEQVNFV